ncbi:hypothetical protein PF007_g24531, partial [Phytophthora fragariae]
MANMLSLWSASLSSSLSHGYHFIYRENWTHCSQYARYLVEVVQAMACCRSTTPKVVRDRRRACSLVPASI